MLTNVYSPIYLCFSSWESFVFWSGDEEADLGVSGSTHSILHNTNTPEPHAYYVNMCVDKTASEKEKQTENIEEKVGMWEIRCDENKCINKED